MLLRIAGVQFQRLGMTEVTLTVTEANTQAVSTLCRRRLRSRHSFNAAVWTRR